MKLKEKINRRLNHFTVIATVLEVLQGHISALEENCAFDGLTARQVEIGFNRTAQLQGKRWFFPSYIQRHTKPGDFFVEVNGRYRLRDEWLAGMTIQELKDARASILAHWESYTSAKQLIVSELQAASALPTSEVVARRHAIEHQFLNEGGGNAQIFNDPTHL